MNEKQLHFLRIAKQALREYDLGAVHVDERRVVGHIGFSGYQMVKFRVRGEESDYLVNVHDAKGNRTVQDYRLAVTSHLLWLEALHRETDLVVQEPVRNRSGGMVTAVQDEGNKTYLVTLLQWISGEVIWDEDRDIDPAEKSTDTLYAVGTVLGKLHLHSSEWAMPNRFTRPRSEVEILPKNLNRLRQGATEGRIQASDFATLEKVVEHFLSHIAGLGRSPHTWGLLHGDFSWSNCVMHQNEVRPIDFDWCCFGHYLGDLGWAFAVMKPIPAPHCQAFLDGYAKYFRLPTDHIRFIEGFFIEACIRLLSWRVGSPDESFPTLSRFVDGAFSMYLDGKPFLLEWMEEL